MIRLFVYGTLRYGGSANFYLRDGHLEKRNVWAPNYQMVDLGRYPAAVESHSAADKILGDIYSAGIESVGRIDRYEGPDYYRKYDRRLDAFIYLSRNLAIGQFPRVASGDWLAYAQSNNIPGYP